MSDNKEFKVLLREYDQAIKDGDPVRVAELAERIESFNIAVHILRNAPHAA